MITYSNPRMQKTISDWPSGSRRVTAAFYVEVDPKRGERGVRVTTGAPKKTTYAPKVRIVDGDDGRTYIAELTECGHVSIMRGDMKFQHETVHERDPRLAELLKLFEDSP